MQEIIKFNSTILTYMAIHLLHSFIAYKNMHTNKKKGAQ